VTSSTWTWISLIGALEGSYCAPTGFLYNVGHLVQVNWQNSNADIEIYSPSSWQPLVASATQLKLRTQLCRPPLSTRSTACPACRNMRVLNSGFSCIPLYPAIRLLDCLCILAVSRRGLPCMQLHQDVRCSAARFQNLVAVIYALPAEMCPLLYLLAALSHPPAMKPLCLVRVC
jgi:hypothetical protein